jgi:hypothetical protein
MLTTKKLAAAIERDLLAEKPKRKPEITCFLCDRPYIPQPYTGQDGSTRFCSDRCRDAFDAGLPRNVDLPTANDWIGFDMSRVELVAGTVPRCDASGNLAVELHRKDGEVFCHWRCRDGKPRDCIACGKNLYCSGRKGPYCSDGCANSGGLKGKKKR